MQNSFQFGPPGVCLLRTNMTRIVFILQCYIIGRRGQLLTPYFSACIDTKEFTPCMNAEISSTDEFVYATLYV